MRVSEGMTDESKCEVRGQGGDAHPKHELRGTPAPTDHMPSAICTNSRALAPASASIDRALASRNSTDP